MQSEGSSSSGNNPDPEAQARKVVRLNRIMLALAIFAIVMMCIALSASYYVVTRPTPTPTPTETATPTSTIVPTSTLAPTPTKTEPPSARSAGAQPKDAYLPGLTPGAVVQAYIIRLYQCSDPVLNEAGLYEWICTQDSSYGTNEVHILSRGEETVDQVVATFKTAEDSRLTEEIGHFLGEAAGLQYTGSAPGQATDWVRSKVSSLQAGEQPLQAVFGDVYFVLSCSGEDWTLTVGELPDDLLKQ